MTDDSVSEHVQKPRGAGCALATLVMSVLGLVALPFLPFLLAGLESLFFKSNKVQDFCRYLGIHDELSALYDAVFQLFR